ncbi:MAG: radical SAM protein, partial [Nitrospirota bacterium]
MRFPKHKILLVNEAGEFLFLKTEEFEQLISFNLDLQGDIYKDLKAKHFLVDSEASLAPVIDLMATKYRTKKSFLKNFTSLHMVVVTLRCNHRCDYCHASSKDMDDRQWDMNTETSRKVVEMIFQSPSPSIKIEFQGGEPLLNFKTVKEIIEYAERINRKEHKNLSFVLCTNLSLITEDILNFLKKHSVLISTSLDGPKEIHGMHRILRKGGSSYEIFIEKLKMTRAIVGEDKVSALLTITKDSIHGLTRVIDEYVRLGFHGVFLRALNPYGRARTAGKVLNYKVEEFVNAYKNALRYIIELNLGGVWI